MFGHIVLKPEIGRSPVYDNVYNKQDSTQVFTCAHCGERISLNVVECAGRKSRDPETVVEPDHGAEIRQHFGILEKSLANGWPRLSTVACAKCDCQYLVYVAAFEPRNGWQQLVLQGITELLPSSPSLQPTASGRD
ncbi:hypothetical protein P3G55_21075 [Leptospira sp. 96542]|nr:hypothetical protein [Leptospira sp. 96542]